MKRILVCTDGSPRSTGAAKLAVNLARTHRARLIALHVIPPFSPPVYMDGMVPYPELYSPEQYALDTERDAKRMLGRIVERARAAKVRVEALHVVGAPPWKEIIRAARKRKCDLVVMASHGRRGLAGLLLGSETVHVLTHSKIPVLVTR